MRRAWKSFDRPCFWRASLAGERAGGRLPLRSGVIRIDSSRSPESDKSLGY
jgi:hypothetical protein